MMIDECCHNRIFSILKKQDNVRPLFYILTCPELCRSKEQGQLNIGMHIVCFKLGLNKTNFDTVVKIYSILFVYRYEYVLMFTSRAI